WTRDNCNKYDGDAVCLGSIGGGNPPSTTEEILHLFTNSQSLQGRGVVRHGERNAPKKTSDGRAAAAVHACAASAPGRSGELRAARGPAGGYQGIPVRLRADGEPRGRVPSHRSK